MGMLFAVCSVSIANCDLAMVSASLAARCGLVARKIAKQGCTKVVLRSHAYEPTCLSAGRWRCSYREARRKLLRLLRKHTIAYVKAGKGRLDSLMLAKGLSSRPPAHAGLRLAQHVSLGVGLMTGRRDAGLSLTQHLLLEGEYQA